MKTEETRALIQAYYDAMAAGNRDKLADLLAEDVAWYPPEAAPLPAVTGRDAVARALGGDVLKEVFDMAKPFDLSIHRVLADGDVAVVQHSISATTRDGAAYDNEYCWVYLCRDGKIARLDEYADTLKAARIMKWEDERG